MIVVREKAQATSLSTHLTQTSWIVFFHRERFWMISSHFFDSFWADESEDGANVAERRQLQAAHPMNRL